MLYTIYIQMRQEPKRKERKMFQVLNVIIGLSIICVGLIDVAKMKRWIK